MEIKPVALEGKHVRLEPMRLDHVAALWRVGAYEEIWRYIPYTMRSEDSMRSFIEAELRKQQAGLTLRFATIAKPSEQPVGSTSDLNIGRQHRRLEIGGTWVTLSWQRSAVNTEAKYLQLSHAFETLGCIRKNLRRIP
jgi:RimJ/RimL family protein N-acetyltransferase